MRDIYLSDDRFQKLVNALVAAKPQNPFTGQFEASDFVTALGEAGGIWPASILDDPARGYQLRRAIPYSENHAAHGPAKPLDDDDDVNGGVKVGHWAAQNQAT